MLAHVFAAVAGVLIAQGSDLPNANLPGNSPSLPNSNLPGPPPLRPNDEPIMLPNSDTSGWSIAAEREAQIQQQRQARQDQLVDETARWEQETRQLAAKALEQAESARADSAQNAATQQQQLQVQQQQQLQLLQQQQQPPPPANQQQP